MTDQNKIIQGLKQYNAIGTIDLLQTFFRDPVRYREQPAVYKYFLDYYKDKKLVLFKGGVANAAIFEDLIKRYGIDDEVLTPLIKYIVESYMYIRKVQPDSVLKLLMDNYMDKLIPIIDKEMERIQQLLFDTTNIIHLNNYQKVKQKILELQETQQMLNMNLISDLAKIVTNYL